MFEKIVRPKREIESVFSLINIIFLLIVFFLIAGHITSSTFKVTPPWLNKGGVLQSGCCTIYVSKDKLNYQGKQLTSHVDSLVNLSKNCHGEVLLATESSGEALAVVNALNRLKPYFKKIKLLVVNHK